MTKLASVAAVTFAAVAAGYAGISSAGPHGGGAMLRGPSLSGLSQLRLTSSSVGTASHASGASKTGSGGTSQSGGGISGGGTSQSGGGISGGG